MRSLEIARRFAQLGETKQASRAYYLALNESGETNPNEELEAALYLLQFGGGTDYKVSYTVFCRLYNSGFCKEDILQIMDEAFYAPNVKQAQSRYRKNCALLEKYPYIFRKDFLKFEALPIRFYPFDDNSYTPYYPEEERFGDYINPKEPVIRHNFFKDLEKPILAQDIFSQYELEYLRDNVRRSEDAGRENHVYLHYSSFAQFCAWLSCLNLKPLLEEKKLVFLFEDELDLYPIDFQARFHIDYSAAPPKPFTIREIKRLIWHVQLSSHNGGDFFNEVMDFHPNLMAMSSVMMSDIEKDIATTRKGLELAQNLNHALQMFQAVDAPHRLVEELYRMKNPTDKDLLVFLHLKDRDVTSGLDPNARISPAIFFQPHFGNVICTLEREESTGRTILQGSGHDEALDSPALRGFPYIKTFVPLRRFTTSYAATVRFVDVRTPGEIDSYIRGEREHPSVMSDLIFERILNRTFMVDPEERLYKDSTIVRFEDGKLNSRATFTALAAFLDLPYTESMTYCSEFGDQRGGQAIIPGNAPGFDPVSVYRTYDEFANDSERRFLEYFLQDAYAFYGYDFQFYDGKPMDLEQVKDLILHFDTLNSYMRRSWDLLFEVLKVNIVGDNALPEDEEERKLQMREAYLKTIVDSRLKNAENLMRGLQFVSKRGQPLQMMPLLQLDPELLEQPLYH